MDSRVSGLSREPLRRRSGDPAPAHCRRTAGLILFAAALGTSCTGSARYFGTQEKLDSLLLAALEADTADQRRRAVDRLGSEPEFASQDECVKTMALILRTDPSDNVRGSAARALGQSRDAAAFEPLLLALEAERHPQLIRAVGPRVQLRCIEALMSLYQSGTTHVDEARLIRILAGTTKSPDREVRLGSIRMLGHVAHPQSVHVLRETVAGAEFIAAHEAEKSLLRLTRGNDDDSTGHEAENSFPTERGNSEPGRRHSPTSSSSQ